MKSSNPKKIKIINIIKANKWYTYDEAEAELRKHWNPDNNKNGDYLSMKRSQIQKILRSDIIGTYLEIHKQKEDQSDDDWLMKTLYGWSQKESFFLDYNTGKEKECCENLHVFPKYDNLFLNSDLEQSIILSSFDEQLGDEDKVEMREIYEELNGGFGKGKIPFLMTEPYLFALKHEIERRQYPTKKFHLKPHSPKDIRTRLSDTLSYDEIQKTTFELIDEFIQKVDEEIATQQSIRDIEKEKLYAIHEFLRRWKSISTSEINNSLEILSKEALLKDFDKFYSKFNQPFEYMIDADSIKNKSVKKFFGTNREALPNDTLRGAIQNYVYSLEQYNLDKLESSLSKDMKFINDSIIFRKKFSKRLHQILRDIDAKPILISALNHAGIHE